MKKRKPKPVVQFKVYPDSKRGLFWTVEVYRTLGDLRAASSPFCRKALAVTENSEVYRLRKIGSRKVFKKKLELGTIRFALKHIGTAVIVHECLHAAFGWYRRKFKSNVLDLGYDGGSADVGVADIEEEMCYALDYTTQQVVSRFYREGFYDE